MFTLTPDPSRFDVLSATPEGRGGIEPKEFEMMKKFFVLLLVMLLLAGCAPAAQSMAVQLPEKLVVLIGVLVMVGVTQGFKWLSSKLGGVDLSGDAAKVAAALSSVIVVAINYGLQLVPAAYDSWLSALFAFLIVLFGGAGFYSWFLRKKQHAAKSKAKG